VFHEVKRVLRDDGVLWLNLGDSYGSGTRKSLPPQSIAGHYRNEPGENNDRGKQGFSKQLIGIPWRVALALQADGWYLRSDIIWNKPNPMPESVTDRPTKSHEYVFLLTKNAKYYYDADAIKENEAETTPARKLRGVSDHHKNIDGAPGQTPHSMSKPRPNVRPGRGGENAFRGQGHFRDGNGPANRDDRDMKDVGSGTGKRNKRSVWTINTQPYQDAHFATFPEELPRTCILAGTSERGCCPKCGSPWERVVESKPATSKPCPKTQAAHKARGGTGEPTGTVGKSGSGRINGYTKTTGWQPTCSCNYAYPGCPMPKDDPAYVPYPPVSCTVLDPFAGSGTVGEVAESLARNSILIELNPTYCNLIKKRTAQQVML